MWWGNQKRKKLADRIIMMGSYGDENSRYGWNINHIIAKEKGGNENSNLRCAHIICNFKKGNN